MEKLWNKIWRDKRGRVVIWQTPNRWLIGWAILTCASLVTMGLLSKLLTWSAEASLVVWSILEISKGVNYFRRGLGIVVLTYCILTILRSF